MTTAQQLGLIGNSIKVQSLPTASAETFGAGNRFYTLIGQQEGYITGHTYHTVVANDVYSWEDVGNALMLLALVDGTITANSSIEVALSNFSRQPFVDDTLIVYSNASQYALMKVSAVTSTAATLIVKDNSTANIVSTKGIDGTDYLFYYGSDIFAPLEPSFQTSVTLSNFNRTPVVGDYGTMIIDNPSGDSYIQVFNVKSIGETTCNITGVMYSRLTRRYYACNTTTPKVPVVGNLITKTKDPESNPLYEVKQDDLMVAFDTADIDGNVYLVLADVRGITKLTNGKLSVNAMIQAVSSINGTSAAVDIVQTTGQSESAVMSQKAVTDELNKKANSTDLATVATSGSYNDLANIPVINQDLTASGFTPVANTYYRHTGTTTNTFTQGVIYYYDGTEYKALDGSGGSGGGTTLNKYVYECTTRVDGGSTNDIFRRIADILTKAKGKISIRFHIVNSDDSFIGSYCVQKDTDTLKTVLITAIHATPNIRIFQYELSDKSNRGYFGNSYDSSIYPDNGTLGGLFGSTSKLEPFEITYYNDTEIT